MLRRTRIVLAVIFFVAITLLFLDFTGTLYHWFGWMAKVQFLPAVLALNLGIIAILLLLTLVFGRIYCSVICPLGVMQDVIAWFGKKGKKNRYSYSKPKSWLRWGILLCFVVALILGISAFVAILAPYSSYGRIASNLFSPIYLLGNNLFVSISEKMNLGGFEHKNILIGSLVTFIIAAVSFVVLFILSWRNGRTYCNTVCPVGTLLGVLARFSLFRPIIDRDKCVKCNLCSKSCKAACIDISGGYSIDYAK